MVKVKICGITDLEDARLSIELGADMIGFNFYEKSKRFISPEKVELLVDNLSARVEKVGVFVNPTVDEVLFARTLGQLDAVQLHGDETEDFISELKASVDTVVIKAIRVRTSSDIQGLRTNADAILLDTFSANEFGGTGAVFDWTLVPGSGLDPSHTYLAGGLDPENVVDAVRTVHPYAVDVASGVESSPGRKDPAKLEAFIMNAKRA